MGLSSKLSPADLQFVVTTVATRRQDYDHVASLVRDKDDFLEIMLEDESLFDRVMREEAWLKVSPFLLFAILLRQAQKELKREPYTLERTGRAHRLPVFDSSRVANVLQDPGVREYLADMLASFTRIESGVIYFRSRGRVYRRSFSDLDMDDMLELSQRVEAEFRTPFYKRIADITLFLVGLFPEYIFANSPGSTGRPRIAGRKLRTLEEYQEEGKKFYRLTAESAEAREEDGDIWHKMADNFDLVKKPLNLMAERYITPTRFQWFPAAY